jgi:phosphatidylglycerophosphate synthase
LGRAFLAFRMIHKPVLTGFPVLKRVDPDMISGLSLALSPVAYLLLSERAIAASIAMVFLVLLLDALDGIVARAKEQKCKDGWMVDVAVDRVSEAIICLALSRVFIVLTILNLGLALLSCHIKKHAIIPLRQVTLVILIAYFVLQFHPVFFYLDQFLFCW